ncbi:MAG: hypothetical protein NZ519_12725, partial [Bacteroidia bacterium]|nr:hypothetical protein [Bacteroidia bacterium]
CDLYFYNDYQFLLNELDTYNIILTPHWRNSNPNLHIDKSHEHFEHLFFAGLFNAGFIGCNQHAKHMIEWWAACCVKLIPQIVKSE